jgi:hypothetical protein
MLSTSPQHQHASPPGGRSRKPTWPPLPSVEDETASLAKEIVSSTEVRQHAGDGDGEPPMHTKGTVDQQKVLEALDHPRDRRYVLVSDPSGGGSSSSSSSTSTSTGLDRRRKSVAERGNMAPVRTDAGDPPVFTERISTPYAYTKPQKESTAPSRAEFLSPESLTPVSASVPVSSPTRDTYNNMLRDQNAKTARPTCSYSRHGSFSRPSPIAKPNVFEDSDVEPDDSTHLRAAERKPARYSFSKNDLQSDDLKKNLRDSQPKPELRRRESGHRPQPTFRKEDSSSSSKDNHYGDSPRSSSSSLNSGIKKTKPALVETGHRSSSRTSSRPASPLQHASSPKLSSPLRESPATSRPTSRGNASPASPLFFSTTVQPSSPGRVPIVDADWYATYPPPTARDVSQFPSRMNRYDTMPDPYLRIDVLSSSPARLPVEEAALPYPADDWPLDVFMPSEQHFQFNHSTVGSPRQKFSDSPRTSSSPIAGSPRLKDETYRSRDNIIKAEDLPRTRKIGSHGMRSHVSLDDRRERPARLSSNFDLDKPLPSCPRSLVTAKYDDWYSLHGYRNFDMCPSCFNGVFVDTPFAVHFSQTRFGERPTQRFCDFSSPWIRLAWLLTIKQRRASLELIYALADIADVDRPCPDDREVGSDRVTWYGIPDQKDGVHVANFAICSCDKRMIEALWPTMCGYFKRLTNTYASNVPEKYTCSLRTSSRRFPKYLDLLVELGTEAQDLGQRPNMNRFVQMARENAFKGECAMNRLYIRKPWIFIPSLPEFTVCEECYNELVWPAYQSKKTPNTIPRLFNKALQLVPNESSDIGSSCCLYSPRMRKVFDTSVREADFTYLRRKAVERKRAEMRIAREKKEIVNWMAGLDRGSSQWERARDEMKALEDEWASWE